MYQDQKKHHRSTLQYLQDTILRCHWCLAKTLVRTLRCSLWACLAYDLTGDWIKCRDGRFLMMAGLLLFCFKRETILPSPSWGSPQACAIEQFMLFWVSIENSRGTPNSWRFANRKSKASLRIWILWEMWMWHWHALMDLLSLDIVPFWGECSCLVALAVQVCNNRIKLVMFGCWTQPVTRDSAPKKVPPSGGSVVCILRFLVLAGATC